jgi:NADH-quinone oxidoreductase subunit C
MIAQNVSTTPTEPFAPSEAHAAVHAMAIESVRHGFGDHFVEAITFRDETTLVVERERIADILAHLRDHPDLRFDRLADLTAVDYLDAPTLAGIRSEVRFAVVYHLMSRRSLARLRVRALVPEDDPSIASVTGLFPMANWPEREVYDLMGISFDGHPDLKRIMLPEDWDGHPLRKDYPIGAEEVQFSFNEDEIAAQYPQTLEEREDRYFVPHPLNN